MARFKMNAGFLVVAVVILLVFGLLSIGLLGFFPGLSSDAKISQSRSYWGGTSGYEGTTPPSYGGSGYWVYNPLKGADSLWFFIVTIVMPLVTLVRMADKTEKNDLKTLGAGFIGSLLLFGAIFVFIGGFRDMLSLYPSQSYAVPTWGQQYGWLVESIVFGLLSIACLHFAERWRKELGSPRSIYSLVAHNAGLFLTLYAVLTLVSYSNSFLDVVKSAIGGASWTSQIVYDPPRLLGWLAYSLILAGVAYKTVEYSAKIDQKNKLVEYTFNTPASFSGLVLFGGGLIMVLNSLYQLIYSAYGNYWYADFLVGLVFGGCGLFLLHWMLRKQEEQGIVRTGHYIPMAAGALLVILGLFGAIFGLNSALQSGSDYQLKSFFNSVVYLAVGGGLLFMMHEWTRNKYDAKRVQEGSFMNGAFEDTEASRKAAAEEQAQIETAFSAPAPGMAEILKKLDSIDRRLANIEKSKR